MQILWPCQQNVVLDQMDQIATHRVDVAGGGGRLFLITPAGGGGLVLHAVDLLPELAGLALEAVVPLHGRLGLGTTPAHSYNNAMTCLDILDSKLIFGSDN